MILVFGRILNIHNNVQLACATSLPDDHSVCSLHSAGGCQKRLREDTGSDDRDFIKRMKGDFDQQLLFQRITLGSDDLNPFAAETLQVLEYK